MKVNTMFRVINKSLHDKRCSKLYARSSHKLYNTYKGMLARCYNKNSNDYKNYGGRGITVCDEWKNDFLAYVNHVELLPNSHIKTYSLDRVNNNGNYEPNNIRWATKHLQSTNSRKQTIAKYKYTGVYKLKDSDRWYSGITVNGTRIGFGGFQTEVEALGARNKYIIENDLREYEIQEYKYHRRVFTI